MFFEIFIICWFVQQKLFYRIRRYIFRFCLNTFVISNETNQCFIDSVICFCTSCYRPPLRLNLPQKEDFVNLGVLRKNIKIQIPKSNVFRNRYHFCFKHQVIFFFDQKIYFSVLYRYIFDFVQNKTIHCTSFYMFQFFWHACIVYL